MLDIRAFNSALLKTFFDIAKNPKKYQDPAGNTEQKAKDAVQEFVERYDQKKTGVTNINDIDLENVTIIKENE